jgi:hypothetical protein
MTTTITRQQDGVTLPFPSVSGLVHVAFVDPAIYGVTKTRTWTAGGIGEQTPLSSTIAPKPFTISFDVHDVNGVEARELKTFFAISDGYYRIDSPLDEWAIAPGLEFTVVRVQHSGFGRDMVEILCQARYGDWVDEIREVLYTAPLAAGAVFPGWSALEINSNGRPCSVEVRLESTASTATWDSFADIQVGSSAGELVLADIGVTLDNGSLGDYDGKTVALDSYRQIVAGEARIDTLVSNPWRVASPGSATIQVPSFTNPASTSITVTISFVSVAQQTVPII